MFCLWLTTKFFQFKVKENKESRSLVKVTVDFQRPIIFLHQIEDLNFNWISPKNYSQNLKRERVIHKHVDF